MSDSNLEDTKLLLYICIFVNLAYACICVLPEVWGQFFYPNELLIIVLYLLICVGCNRMIIYEYEGNDFWVIFFSIISCLFHLYAYNYRYNFNLFGFEWDIWGMGFLFIWTVILLWRDFKRDFYNDAFN